MAVSKAELKKLAFLKAKKGRKEEGMFLVGGVRLLEEALSSNFLPIKIYYSLTELSKRGQEILARFKSGKTDCILMSKKEIDSISDTENTQGIVALFKTPEIRLSKLYKPSFRRLLLCDQINDPGNLGTLIRSARAFGFDMIMVTDKSAELYNPKVVRSSAGAIFGLPAASVSHLELSDFISGKNIKIAAAVSNHNGQNDDSGVLALSKEKENPLILAIGSEAEGLSQEVLELSDHKISIKHDTKVESLNAAIAGSILMYEIWQKDKK